MGEVVAGGGASETTELMLRNGIDTVPDRAELFQDAELAGAVVGRNAVAPSRDQTSRGTRFQINLTTIIISALIFIAILAWFDWIQTSIYVIFDPELASEYVPLSIKFWYSVIVTFLTIALVYLIYYYSELI